MKFARETQDGSAETKEDQISREDAKAQREEVPKSLITDSLITNNYERRKQPRNDRVRAGDGD
jgi:hypothetical protein